MPHSSPPPVTTPLPCDMHTRKLTIHRTIQLSRVKCKRIKRKRGRCPSRHVHLFCEARSKRSVEVYKGKNLDPPPPAPQWAEKGGQEQFLVAKSLLNRDYVRYVGFNEL